MLQFSAWTLPHNADMLPMPTAIRCTPWRGLSVGRLLLASVVVLALAGCADTAYYWQSVRGHLRVMHAASPVNQWLDDATTPQALKMRLRLSQQIRDYAVAELGLPDNASYRSYADLHRSAVVWNVVAAPELSLTLHTWCFPLLGCVAYHGYFDDAQAQLQAQSLRAQGLEATVYGVPAYSTLGWLNWLGGDPLLNTFIAYGDGELARLLFHELAHQVVYARDDTMFNESFATAVERLGSARWLDAHGSAAAREQYALAESRRHDFRVLVLSTREQLEQLYRNPDGLGRATLLQHKQLVMQAFRERYTTLKSHWDGYAGYDSWVAQANNASLGAQAAYDELVPQFEALFMRQGQDWPAFYDAVKRLAALPTDERRTALAQAGATP